MQGDMFGLVGAVIEGRYRVDGVVGEGGFGVVYRGQHLTLGHPIAIKCLKTPPHFSPQARDAFIAKFREEGQLLSRLRECPAVVHVYDFGVTVTGHGPVPFLVLEWLDGQTLEKMLEQRRAQRLGPMHLAEAVGLLMPAFDALAYAHRMKIAHRDIKPANVYIAQTTRGQQVKVLDFGIAKVMQEGDNAEQAATGTGSGFQAFSPGYGAPEQFFSKRYGASGPWTDVHALALMLVEMVSGQSALRGDDMAELLMNATADERPTPRARGVQVPDPIEAVLHRALALSASQRYPDAEQFYEALRGALHACGQPVPPPLPSLAAAYTPAQPPAAYGPPFGAYGPPPGGQPPTGPGHSAPYQPGTPPGAHVSQPSWAGGTTPPNTPTPFGVTAPPPQLATGPAVPTGPYGVSGYAGGTAPPATSPYGGTGPVPTGLSGTGPRPGDTGPRQSTGTAVGAPLPGGMGTTGPGPMMSTGGRAVGGKKSSAGLIIAVVVGLGMLGLGAIGVGLVIFGAIGTSTLATAPSASGGAGGVAAASHADGVEVGLGVAHDRTVHAVLPQAQAPNGRWHWRLYWQDGRVVKIEQVRPTGAVAQSEKYEYPAAGGRIEHQFDAHGTEQQTTTVTDAGVVTTVLRSGVTTYRNCNRIERTFDAAGNVTETRCLAQTGLVVVDESGCQSLRATYNDLRQETSTGCFAVDGGKPRPITDREGVHLSRYQYDGFNNQTMVRFFDETGAPVAKQTDGCFGHLFRYDNIGNQVADTCLDASGSPRAQIGSNVATTQYDVTPSGCLTAVRYLDVVGQPAALGETATIAVEMNPTCDLTGREQRKKDGSRTGKPLGIASWANRYDNHGDLVGTSCLDEARKPVNCSNGQGSNGSVVSYDRDPHGRISRERYYRADGTPSVQSNSYPHETRNTYGEDGRLATSTFHDETGRQVTALGKTARMTFRYDALGGLVSEAYFGVDQAPIEAVIGCHELRSSYDTSHRLARVECLDVTGQIHAIRGLVSNGITWPLGAARVDIDRSGPVPVNVYSGPTGQQVKRVECKKAEQSCYR